MTRFSHASRSFFALGTIAIAFLASGIVSADMAAIPAVRDNTLIENAEGGRSNGSGPNLFLGRVGSSVIIEPLSTPVDRARRAVLKFDVASYLPAGATVVDAHLTLYLNASNGGPQTAALHRLVADWGEGASSSGGGNGAFSESGDATWIHTFHDESFWAQPGGDFVASSASAVLDLTGYVTWGPTERMVEDIQGWLDSPESNHGWLLRGNEALADSTSKRISSRENNDATTHPMLVVEFDVAPPPGGKGGKGGKGDDDEDDEPGGNAARERWRPLLHGDR